MENEQVADALARFERAVTETLGALAAAKAEPIGGEQLDEAIALVIQPLTEGFKRLPPLSSQDGDRIAGCANACSDVVEGLGRTDNLGGQRLHREGFTANVEKMSFHASWIDDALYSHRSR